MEEVCYWPARLLLNKLLVNKCSQNSDFNTRKCGAPVVVQPDTPLGNLTHTEDDCCGKKTLGEHGVVYTYRRGSVRTHSLCHLSDYALEVNPKWLPQGILGSQKYLSLQLLVPGAESSQILCSGTQHRSLVSIASLDP